MLRAGAEFGLSPSSRTGIVCPTKAAEDDLEMFIAGKAKPTPSPTSATAKIMRRIGEAGDERETKR